MRSRQLIASLGLGALGILILSFTVSSPEHVISAEPVKVEETPQVKPVEDDMHEFMEYVFQPTFKRLKTAMAEEPANNAGWKTIKADGLSLAESGNLLMFRGPAEHRADWNEHAAAVREHGGELYQAAKKKDFAASRKSYESMITKCNACHTQFADGEHQLEP